MKKKLGAKVGYKKKTYKKPQVKTVELGKENVVIAQFHGEGASGAGEPGRLCY